ncbi:Hypp3761 [Branchiostoma lanceolatum]|uniref:Hypp3761 protein n=1 Tax=Branchiostoma lanceolatum TaxID=7740 RepID=A0A8K0ESW7_BRALA|nr:Hypp3761 [Branchiostoma lanceolatum]
MANEFIAALVVTISSTPHTICFVWRAITLIYWLLTTIGGFWDDHNIRVKFVVLTLSLQEFVEWPIPHLPSNGSVVVAIKVMHQGLLCVLLYLVHDMPEKDMLKMTLRHRVCYSVVVENCVAFNLTWNYVQTATLVSALLVQDTDIGPDAVVSLNLVLLAICVLVTVTVELVFLGKLRWTAAGHFPIQVWVSFLYYRSFLDGRIVWVLLVVNALLVIIKFTPEKCKYHKCVVERMGEEEEDADEKLLEV